MLLALILAFTGCIRPKVRAFSGFYDRGKAFPLDAQRPSGFHDEYTWLLGQPVLTEKPNASFQTIHQLVYSGKKPEHKLPGLSFSLAVNGTHVSHRQYSAY